MANRTEPWHRQPSVIVSIVSVVVSTLALTVSAGSAWRGSQDAIRAKKEELRKLVIDMQEIRAQYGKDGPVPGAPQNGLMKAKQGVSLQAAEKLVEDLGTSEVTSYEYGLLAIEFMDDGDIRKSEDSFKKAAAVAKNINQKAQAHRMLAMTYFEQTPLRDPDKGRKVFAATDQELATASANDPMATLLRAENTGAWASAEIRAGFPQNGADKLAEAHKLYDALPAEWPLRDQLIAQLDARVMGAPAGGHPFIATPNAPISCPPPELLSAVSRLSFDEASWLIENPQGEGETIVWMPGGKGGSSGEERARYERLARYGLVSEIPLDELKSMRSTDGTPDAGVRCTGLYPAVRAFLLTQFSETFERAKAGLPPGP